VNFSFDVKTVAAILLLLCAGWLFLSLPARMTVERKKLAFFRQKIADQMSTEIGPYSKAPSKSFAGSIVIHEVETVEYEGRNISGLNWRVIVRNFGGQYWLHTFYSDGRKALSEPIDELRARRALFNKPVSYKEAFGELPDRKRIAADFDLGPIAKSDVK
jgi:hypothetical protein